MSARARRAGRLDPQGRGPLVTFAREAEASPTTRRNRLWAVHHLETVLGRSADWPDLNSPALAAVNAHLVRTGAAAGTRSRVLTELVRLAKAGVSAGLTTSVPHCERPKSPRRVGATWSPVEVSRILLAARSLRGDVGGLPAASWWAALVLLVADLGRPVAELLALPCSAWDARAGRLRIGLVTFELHGLANAALVELSAYPRERLLPWPLDGGHPPFHMLYRRFRELLYRADLPYGASNLFQRLQQTARRFPRLLDAVDLRLPFQPREGSPVHPRPRDVRRRQARAAVGASKSAGRSTSHRQRGAGSHSGPVWLSMPEAQTLQRFLVESYGPQRLAAAKLTAIGEYQSTLRRYGGFLSHEPTFANLDEDCVDRFLAWLKTERHAAHATIHGHRARLLALWRHAWRKRKVPELPRDVMDYVPPKRLPEAWSTEEVWLILRSASEETGTIAGVAAGEWWVALLLVLYDTGLRIEAALAARSDQLSADGWLTIACDTQKQDADQAFRLHPETLRVLEQIGPESRELIFSPANGPALGPKERNGTLRRILQRAGLPHGRRDLFHKFRRTSATAVASALDEIAAKLHLGHSSLEMTRRYVDPRKIRRRKTAAEVMERPGWRGAVPDVPPEGGRSVSGL